MQQEAQETEIKELIEILMLYFIAAFGLTNGGKYGGTSQTYNVVDYGAAGDGSTDDSQAFLKAWRDVCKATGDLPTLMIPSNKTFLLAPLKFEGYCEANAVNVQVWGDIVAPGPHQCQWSNIVNSANCWLAFSKVHGLIINGTGNIDGRGSSWWNNHLNDVSDKNDGMPTVLYFFHCYDIEVSGLHFVDPPRNHISITNCERAYVSHVSLSAPEDSPNTDGIDISGSTKIQIHHSYIETGDDCIAINGNTSHVIISGVTCGPGHGISVGSLGSNNVHDTVEGVHVKNCTLNRTQNGARIKTWQGGSGYARNITFEHLILWDVANPIIIDQYYCNGKTDCENQTSAVEVSDITYTNVFGSCAKKEAINLSCSQSKACTNIVMDKIGIYPSFSGENATSFCYNAAGKATSTVPEVPCLSRCCN